MKSYRYDAVVVGSGAAGFAAANRIRDFGTRTAAIVTEDRNAGTSRNAGSDKQTYYKLSLAGDAPDSVRAMAEDLFAGGAVDGDNALCEAALSVRCFLDLCAAGVPFPTDRYGCYTGYKTDHDPCARATSAGPLTSKFMTEALEKRAEERKIPLYDHLTAVRILKDGDGVLGLLCCDPDGEPVVFRADSVILATGGPAGIYADSVYPVSQTGSTALALDAGASLQNMTEWQYGLASVSPRWNVSGSYMQVLPRFISIGEDGEGPEREFLADFFSDPYEALSNVFLKGYQWPFDSAKVNEGSSVIDLLVYREKEKGRRVFLDYTKNPFGLEKIDFSRLSPEASGYLQKCGACFGTPIERLRQMNSPAIELYRSKGVELDREKLEIALCAQHNNGGISVDHRWQTGVRGLYAVGECAGTHGVRRPGGSALNAGQVGALRAAEHLSFTAAPEDREEGFERAAAEAVASFLRFRDRVTAGKNDDENENCPITEQRRRMSLYAGAIRSAEKIRELSDEFSALCAEIEDEVRTKDVRTALRYRDMLTVQNAVLAAMCDFAETVGASRGSAIFLSENGVLRPGLPEKFRFLPPASAPGSAPHGGAFDRVQLISLRGGVPSVSWRPVRPIPDSSDSFEVVWNGYRKNRNLD